MTQGIVADVAIKTAYFSLLAAAFIFCLDVVVGRCSPLSPLSNGCSAENAAAFSVQDRNRCG
jgi:hypothetical protein